MRLGGEPAWRRVLGGRSLAPTSFFRIFYTQFIPVIVSLTCVLSSKIPMYH